MLRVVMDIVKRYDIDGVHFDDYFYPYAEYNGGQDFRIRIVTMNTNVMEGIYRAETSVEIA
jgi:uncharacterized lipoprotein YddW (UPF0748 family)